MQCRLVTATEDSRHEHSYWNIFVTMECLDMIQPSFSNPPSQAKQDEDYKFDIANLSLYQSCGCGQQHNLLSLLTTSSHIFHKVPSVSAILPQILQETSHRSVSFAIFSLRNAFSFGKSHRLPTTLGEFFSCALVLSQYLCKATFQRLTSSLLRIMPIRLKVSAEDIYPTNEA